MIRTDVITVFLTRGAKLLLLKRSKQVGSYQGRWAGVSGYLEAAQPLEQAWTELKEELRIGPEDASPEETGDPLEVPDAGNHRIWVVHPFRFSLVDGVEVRLDWEHVEMRWCPPQAMKKMNTVPGLWEAWCRVAQRFEPSPE